MRRRRSSSSEAASAAGPARWSTRARKLALGGALLVVFAVYLVPLFWPSRVARVDLHRLQASAPAPDAGLKIEPESTSKPDLRLVSNDSPAQHPAPVHAADPKPLLAAADPASAPAAVPAPTPAGAAGAIPAEDLLGKHKHKKEGKQNNANVEAAELALDRMAEDEFFEKQDVVPYFRFDFVPQEWQYIHEAPRRWTECTMMVDDDPKVYKGVAVHLKGSAGSFRGPDDKPGLSLSMNKFQKAERWNGFLKWHLNNGAQDNSFLNEEFSCAIARAAGVPASRCAHALVKWQKRDLGLFLFKEAFDRDFLAKFFKDTEGDLYDGGFVADIRPEMDKNQGDLENRDNIKQLIAACQEGDPKKRWEKLQQILDVDAYISFIAIEAITCHWDGYNFNRNNYHMYFDPDTGKAHFILHGTDQTFGDANFPITRDPGSMVGQAVMSNPEWKAEYRNRVEKIYDEVLKPIDWPGQVMEVGNKVLAVIAKKNPQVAKEWEPHIKEARDRVANRIAAIGKQLGDMPKPVKVENGKINIDSKGWQQQGSGAVLDEVAMDGKNCFHIRANGESTGSWRKSVNLPPGKYKFVASVLTKGVVATQNSSGDGVGIRISGGTRNGQNGLSGDTPWKDAAFAFDSPGDVVLVLEFRGNKGDAWFDKSSLRVEQVK